MSFVNTEMNVVNRYFYDITRYQGPFLCRNSIFVVTKNILISFQYRIVELL